MNLDKQTHQWIEEIKQMTGAKTTMEVLRIAVKANYDHLTEARKKHEDPEDQ